jgi:hypothetical protein
MKGEEFLDRIFVSVSNKIHFLQVYVERYTAEVRLFNDAVSCLDRITFFYLSQHPPPNGPGSPRSRGFSITHKDAPQSVGLLWNSNQLIAETPTSQHTTITTDKLP